MAVVSSNATIHFYVLNPSITNSEPQENNVHEEVSGSSFFSSFFDSIKSIFSKNEQSKIKYKLQQTSKEIIQKLNKNKVICHFLSIYDFVYMDTLGTYENLFVNVNKGTCIRKKNTKELFNLNQY